MKRIKKHLLSHLYPHSQSNLIDSINFYYSNSPAELTIEHHSNPLPSLDSSSKPLVVKEDEKTYHKTPTNGYISRYPNVFFGCLGYGSSNHLFRECKENKNPTVRCLYW